MRDVLLIAIGLLIVGALARRDVVTVDFVSPDEPMFDPMEGEPQ